MIYIIVGDKMKKLFLIMVLLLVTMMHINATCNDESLNEWAVSVNPKFTLSSKLEGGIYGYAYFLSIEPYREDIKIKVIDGKYSAYGKQYGELYGVGCYTNLEEKTYTIEIYGSDNSKCKNELLKKVTYTVPRFNNMVKEAVCEENPDHELCAPFTNKTKDMTREEFLKSFETEKKD